MRIDLNADVGESFGAYDLGDDAELMKWVTSASVAAGFHAGDPTVLRRTIRTAKAHGVAVGAHPGFPDRQGFGRREMRLSAREAEDLVLYQIAAVGGVAAAEGVVLQHVKPHGALFNMAAVDRPLAEAIARAIVSVDRRLMLFAPPDSELAKAGEQAGLRVAREVFADRAYLPNGQLVPRASAGAVITNQEEVVSRAIKLATEQRVTAIDGSVVVHGADTICVHGDTPGAVQLAASVRQALERAGVEVRAFGEV
jgi:UPF0271 protein